MRQKYEFRYDFDYEIILEVDRNVFTNEKAKIFLDFFLWERDYDKDSEDLVFEALKKIALQCFIFASMNEHNEFGVQKDMENAEGFPKVDGSEGINLFFIEGFDFDEDELEVKNIEFI